MIQQIIANMLITAAIYSIVAVGFVLIYNTTRFFHFAHGVVYAFGAYISYVLIMLVHIPLFCALPLAIIMSSFLGIFMEFAIYCPLRKRGASKLILLFSSLGIYIIIQNIISIAFGDDSKTVWNGNVKEGFSFLGARITHIQIIIIITCLALLLFVAFTLKMTRLGKAMRAVANDQNLAVISGININKVMLLAFAIGSAMAGVAGFLVSLDVGMTPTMGMNALMMGVVAVIIGGVGSVPGVIFGSLLISSAQNMGAWYFDSQWRDAIAFVILLIFLVVRPEGFMGKRINRVTL